MRLIQNQLPRSIDRRSVVRVRDRWLLLRIFLFIHHISYFRVSWLHIISNLSGLLQLHTNLSLNGLIPFLSHGFSPGVCMDCFQCKETKVSLLYLRRLVSPFSACSLKHPHFLYSYHCKKPLRNHQIRWDTLSTKRYLTTNKNFLSRWYQVPHYQCRAPAMRKLKPK